MQRSVSVIEAALAGGRTSLSERESKELLSAYGIPVVREFACATEAECLAALDQLDLPVVVKVDSPDILHKTEAGGVAVGCRDAAEVLAARTDILAAVARHSPQARVAGVLIQEMVRGGTECFIGIQTDAQFGPVVAFGLGGTLIEVIDEVALRVPPVDHAMARQMVAETRAGRVLGGVRGRPPGDLAGVADAIIAVSRLASDWRGVILELDVNPLMVMPGGIKAADAAVVLKGGRG